MPEFASQGDPAVWRILDANQNRAREALRVIEEYLRFSLDDAHLTQIAKELRHRLQAVFSDLPQTEMLRARDTQADVGTEISTPAENSRSSTDAVVAASFSRAEQALRALEEYSKVVDPAVSARLEQLRYATYTLEKAVSTTTSASDRLAGCRVYVLIDAMTDKNVFVDRVKELISAGVDAIQLRDKTLDDRELLDRANTLTSLTRASDTLAIINDRPDIALLSHADGVHVGQEELPVSQIRKLVGTKTLIGLSTHSIQQARDGVLDGADYLGVGPVFQSSTKSFIELAGLDFVRQVADEISLPAFAIGGIGLENVGQVVEAGLRRVAVSSALDVPDVAEKVKDFKRHLTESP